MFTQLYPHNKHGGVDLAAVAAEAGACKHFCPSKWAKVRPRGSEPLLYGRRLRAAASPPCCSRRTENVCHGTAQSAYAPGRNAAAHSQGYPVCLWRARNSRRATAMRGAQARARSGALRAVRKLTRASWQVGGMMQMDGSVKFGNSESGPATAKYAF